MKKTAETLGDRLRIARDSKGLSQKQVAEAIKKETTAYGHYERGRIKTGISGPCGLAIVNATCGMKLLNPE